MKIRDRETRGIGSPAPLSGRGGAATTARASKGSSSADRVVISGRGVDIQRARSLALAAPEIRQEMVDAIVEQLERGEYQVTGADVLPKLIQEHQAFVRE